MLEELEAFLESYLAEKVESTRKQARIALRHWEEYVRQKPCVDIKLNTIDQFILHEKKRLKPRSLYVYLFHIAKYFHSMNRFDLKEHTMNERKRLQLQFEAEEIAEPAPIDHKGVLKMLMTVTKLRDKLILRLLLWSEIPLGCLENLKVRHIIEGERYEFHCKGRIVRGILYSDTPKIIDEIIRKKNLRQNDELIGISKRQIENLIPKYAKKIGIPYKVSPHDLREFGKNPHLRNILIQLYEDDKKR